ncbi:hypothetical protein Tco_0758413 [Tanacetum coccineum]
MSLKDSQQKAVDPTHYRGMIGTLMYLTASRPDLTFDVCMCARYQAKPTEKHLPALMRTLITRVAKILDEVLIDVCNYWETYLLAGHQKGRKALRYPVQKLNILPCLAVDQLKESVKAQVSKILPKVEKNVNEQLEVEKNLYKALVDAYESDKLILDTYGDTVSFKRRRDDEDKDEEPSARSNQGSKRRRARKEPKSTSPQKEKTSKTIGKSTEGSKSHHKSANKSTQAETPMHTVEDLEEPVHQEFVTGDTEDKPDEETSQIPDWFQKPAKPPTPDPGPTFELMKGSCKTLVELEYFFEEVYNATIDQLDRNNPEGQQYPHDLRKPLPLIPNSRGRQVIPFDHFINNVLVYLSGGVSSRTYTTSVMKTKAADYKHIKWIEDLVPNRMWSQVPHLDWITVRRDDDKLYKFKEGDFNRLRIQDIEDMLLLLVQGKLTNLTIEERLAFNVSMRVFKKHCHLKACGRSLIRCRKLPKEAQPHKAGYNKDKKNRLMRIDELHKFSDGTLNDVRTALDDPKDQEDYAKLGEMCWSETVRGRVLATAKDHMIYHMMSSSKQVVRHRYSNPMIQPESEGSTQGYPLDSIEVLSHGPSDALLFPPQPLKFDESDTHVLERFNTSVGNSVKEILFKLNLPDHMSILTDLKIEVKLHSGHGHLDVPHVVDELGKPDIIVVNGTDNQEKNEKQSQNNKTGLGMEKTVKDKAKSKPESQSSQKVNRKVNWSKSKSTPGPKSKKYKFRG